MLNNGTRASGHGMYRPLGMPKGRAHFRPATGWITHGFDDIAKRLLACFLLCLVAALALTLVSPRPALADHQFLWWDDTGDTRSVSVGANSQILIRQGQMEFVNLCGYGGTNDYIYPATDVYVVPAGSVTKPPSGSMVKGSKLEDVSGEPNTIISPTSFGMFVDETIGYTGPSGTIGEGTYAVVYDECQDGYVDPGDFVLDNAFEVKPIPTDVPELPSLEEKKRLAGVAAEELEKFNEWLDNWFKAQTAIDPNPLNRMLYGMGAKPFIADPRAVVRIQIANQAKHYRGIKADPPDPAYEQLSPLLARETIDPQSNAPVLAAAAALGTESSSEGALAEALLRSLERYQGAQEAGSGRWALIHARAIHDYSLRLKLQLAESDNALSDLDAALDGDTTDVDAHATDIQEFVERVRASGFTEEEIREAHNLGLSDAEISQLEADVVALDFSTFSSANLRETIADLQANNSSLSSELDILARDMESNIAILESDTFTPDETPVASAGGPYRGVEGAAVTFSASDSTSPSEVSGYEWDLDGDGKFDDASSASPNKTYDSPFEGLVGVRVTNSENESNVAYARVDIAEANRRPVIDSSTPSEDTIVMDAGASHTFEVSVSDPDGDGTDVEWYVDEAPSGTGASFSYESTSSGIGRRIIEARVDDDSPLGEQVRHRWAVAVLAPDADGDGYRPPGDCDDSDPHINPGTTEIEGNDKDDDCNGTTLDRPGIAVVTKSEDTNDGACDSDCSLREAIDHANSHPNGAQADKITFDIPGEGVKRISPITALPTITDPVIIDGYTQPGAHENTRAVGNDALLKIELNGGKAEYGVDGLTITAGDSAVRGLVINGFSTKFVSRGIWIKAKGNNVIEGNRIGTNAEGTDSSPALANYTGLLIQGAPNNTIGGTTPGARNLITSNESYNVRVENSGAKGNKIQGNYIGTNTDGSAPIYRGFDETNRNYGFSYAYYGVAIVEAPDSIIGGTEPGAGNVISGNKYQNVLINGAGATGARIQGNYIGTDATGTVDLQNPSQSYNVNRPTSGVEIEHVPNILVGGTSTTARNIISGNSDGLVLDGGLDRVHGTRVQGNYIGTDATGTRDLGNANMSIYVFSSTNNTIGGTEPHARNVISGGGFLGSGFGDGVVIAEPNSRGNRVQGNYIGTDAAGTTDLGNGKNGVVLVDGSPNNVIGGTAEGAGNTIAFNDSGGVEVAKDSNTRANSILANSIFSNGGLGIDLDPNATGLVRDRSDDVTFNDDDDRDTGPNNYQNFPELISARSGKAGTRIEGKLNSTANTTFTVQFFYSPETNPSGYGEGRTYLNEKTDVTTDAGGDASFAFETTTVVPVAGS